MTNYTIQTKGRKNLLRLSLQTDFNLEGDILEEGHCGSDISEILKRAETPGYYVNTRQNQIICENKDTGRQYTLVAGSQHLRTDDFATKNSKNADYRFDELLIIDEAQQFLTKDREPEILEFMNGVRKETSRMYDESRRVELEWEEEEKTDVN